MSHKAPHIPFFLNFGLRFLGLFLHTKLRVASRFPYMEAFKTLHRILRQNQFTAYGKAHHFSEILQAETPGELFIRFQRAVPANDYEKLRPFVERQKMGERDVLITGNPIMYATTSGTTGKPKWIPISRSYLRTLYHRMSEHWLYIFVRQRPRAFGGHILQIVGKDVEGYAPDGTIYGSVSGMLVKEIPGILRKRYTAPAEVMNISDPQTRNYVIMTLALQWEDLTFWATANPSTIVELLHTVDERLDQMADDIEHGSFSVEIEPRLLDAIAPYLHANAERAKQLRELKKRYATISPKDYFPYLQVLSTWKCGNAKVYIEKFMDRFNWRQTLYTELGYIATECRFGHPVNASRESVLFPQYHYYEFVDEQELDMPNKHFLQLSELEYGHRYCVYITTNCGLYRYNMNDIVEVGGKYVNTPTVHFISKVNGIVSLTGEKLYEAQFIRAVHQVAEMYNVSIPFFVGFANAEESAYDFYFEFGKRSEKQAPQLLDLFTREVDSKLQQINMEYESKRQSMRLKEPTGHLLQPNAYTLFKELCLKDGFRDGQFKFNLLMQDTYRQGLFNRIVKE